MYLPAVLDNLRDWMRVQVMRIPNGENNFCGSITWTDKKTCLKTTHYIESIVLLDLLSPLLLFLIDFADGTFREKVGSRLQRDNAGRVSS